METQRVSKPNPVEGSLDTVDGSNPAPFDMVNYAIIYRVLYIPGGDRWISEPSNRIILPIYLIEVYRHHQWKGWICGIDPVGGRCFLFTAATHGAWFNFFGRRQTHLKTTWVMQEKKEYWRHYNYHYFNISQLLKSYFIIIFVAPIVKEDYKTTSITDWGCLCRIEIFFQLRGEAPVPIPVWSKVWGSRHFWGFFTPGWVFWSRHLYGC